MGQRRVLIVDDDPRLCRIVTLYLEIEGYDVGTASTAEEGLDEIRSRRPDLVVMDVMMPGMDGIEACRRIRANPDTRDIPVVILTALQGEGEAERARLAGANRMISKPFNLVGLASVVRSLIGAEAAAQPAVGP